jgi:hypothetical protein
MLAGIAEIVATDRPTRPAIGGTALTVLAVGALEVAADGKT